MSALCAIVAASLLAADPVARTDLSVAFGGWARSAIPVDATDHARAGTALTPGGTFHELSRSLDFEVGYAPRLTFDATEPSSVGVLEQGHARAQWRASRLWTIESEAQVTYGKNEQVTDETGTATFDLINLLVPVVDNALDVFADVGASTELDPRTELDLGVMYMAFGALTQQAHNELPLQQGPAVSADVVHAWTAQSSLGAELYASTLHTATSRSSMVRAVGTYGYRFTPTTRLKLAAGISQRISGGVLGYAPSAKADLHFAGPSRVGLTDLAFSGAYGPRSDPLTGRLVDRLDLGASARYHFVPEWFLGGRAGLARERGAGGALVALTSAEAGYQVRNGIQVGVTAQWVLAAAKGVPAQFARLLATTSYTWPDVW